jgi:hypothetical protein
MEDKRDLIPNTKPQQFVVADQNAVAMKSNMLADNLLRNNEDFSFIQYYSKNMRS